MSRRLLIEAIKAIKAEIAATPGFPHDSREDQEARRDALREALREADRYDPHRGPRPPRRTEPITVTHLTTGARCANCGSHRIEIPRPVVAA